MRDRGFLLTLVFTPLIVMLVFGYAFQGDLTDLSTIVINNDDSNYADEIVKAIHKSKYFKVVFVGEAELDEVKRSLEQSKVRALIYIPKNFGAKLNKGEKAEISTFIDSSDYTIFNTLRAAASGIIEESSRGIIQIIINDLEVERIENEERVDEVQVLVDDLSKRVVDIKNTINDLTAKFDKDKGLLDDAEVNIEEKKDQLNDIKKSVDSLMDQFDDIKGSLSGLAAVADPITRAVINGKLSDLEDSMGSISQKVKNVEISKKDLKIDEIQDKIRESEGKISDINESVNTIESSYRGIQDRMDNLHLELKTLKKDFLSDPVGVNSVFIFGEITYIQYLTPAVISMIIFFICVLITLINIIEEKTQKTLFRLMTTPLSTIELMLGKFTVFSLVGVVEGIYIVLIAVIVFKVPINGSVAAMSLIILLLILASTGIGLFFSSIVKTLRQGIMLFPVTVIPFILLSQTFAPIDVMPDFMKYVSHLSPLFYSNIALRGVMIKGNGLLDVGTEVIVLALYAAIALSLGILTFKRRIE